MSLRLHESSHDTKVGIELAGRGVGGQARNDGVVRALARGNAVRMGRVKREISSTILQEERSIRVTTQVVYCALLIYCTCD